MIQHTSIMSAKYLWRGGYAIHLVILAFVYVCFVILLCVSIHIHTPRPMTTLEIRWGLRMPYKSTTLADRNVAFDFLRELFDFYVFPQS